MAEEPTPPKNQPPEISPYVVPVLLAGFGLWCLYDGWFNPSPEMQDHLTFNRIGAALLLPWAAFDFWRVRRRARAAPDDPPAQDSSGTSD